MELLYSALSCFVEEEYRENKISFFSMIQDRYGDFTTQLPYVGPSKIRYDSYNIWFMYSKVIRGKLILHREVIEHPITLNKVLVAFKTALDKRRKYTKFEDSLKKYIPSEESFYRRGGGV